MSHIISADIDVDRLEAITRLNPVHVEEWESSILSIQDD